jgi:hypothetical protein
MLTIRESQMQSLRHHSVAVFESQLVDYLLSIAPPLRVATLADFSPISALPPEIVKGLVGICVRKGRGYGLTWQSSLAAFAVTMFAMAPNFDEHPIASQALNDPEVPANGRVRHLLATLSDADVKAIRANYQPSAWRI